MHGLQPPSVEAEFEALADSTRKVIFVLKKENLEVAKVGKVNLSTGQVRGLYGRCQC